MLRDVFHHPGRVTHVYGERASSSRSLARPYSYEYKPDPRLMQLMLADRGFINFKRACGNTNKAYKISDGEYVMVQS